MSEMPLQEPFLNRARDAFNVARNEIRDASLVSKAVVGVTVGVVAFEWSPLNEFVAGDSGATVYESGRQYGSFSSAVVNSIETGLVVGGLMGATQLATGLLAASAIRTVPNAMTKLSGTVDIKMNDVINNKPSISTALALGNTAVVIEANYKNPNRSFKDDAKLVTAASGVLLGANVIFGTSIGAVVSVLDSIDKTSVSNLIINLAQNPITYLVAFAGVKYRNYLKNKRNSTL